MIILILLLLTIIITLVTIKPILISHINAKPNWFTIYAYVILFIIGVQASTNKKGLFGLTVDETLNLLLTTMITITILTAYPIIRDLVNKYKISKINKLIVEADKEDDEDLYDDLEEELSILGTNKTTSAEIGFQALELYLADKITDEPLEEFAENKYTSPKLLKYLVTADLSEEIVDNLTLNSSLTPEMLTYLTTRTDLSDDAVFNIIINPKTPTESIGYMISNIYGNQPLTTLTADIPEIKEKRRTISKGLEELRKRNPELEQVQDQYIFANYTKEEE